MPPISFLEAVRKFDPGCEVKGKTVTFLNPTRADKNRGSCTANLHTGWFKDFADPSFKGKGVAALQKLVEGAAPAPAPHVSATPLPAAPKGTPGPSQRIAGFTQGESYAYLNEAGDTVFYQVRYEKVGGKRRDKEYRPFHRVPEEKKWKMGKPPKGKPPLYHLDQLVARPGAPVLICEGEKSADAAQKLFPDHVCTASPFGAGSAGEADWSGIKGHPATLWRDADEPGLTYERDVPKLAYAAGAISVRSVQIPADFPVGWDLADPKPQGVNLKEMLAAAVLVPPPAKPIEMLDPTNWLTFDPPPIRWLLRGLLPHKVPAILAGKSNCGKSLTAMQMSMAVATGQPLFGLETDGVARKVLYLSMEDDADEMHRRFRRCLDLLRMSMLWNKTLESRLLANWRAVVPVWASKDLKTLTALTGHLQDFSAQLCATDEKLGLIVLDTFASLADGEENAAEVQQSFWAACHQLVEATGGTTLVIHHVRKNTAQKPPAMLDRLNFENLRGSSAIVGGARAILQMEPITPSEARKLDLDEDRAIAGNYVALALTKLNGGPKGAWMALEQRFSSDVGAGFFDLMVNSDHICAALRSKAAALDLSQAEAILLGLADKVSREEMAKKHWPEDKDQARKLTKAISGLRTKQRWLEKGSDAPTMKGQMVLLKLRKLADTFADSTGQESEQ